MITEQNYIDGRHPLDMIWETKTFLNELQKIIDDRFEDLVKKLGFNEEGTNWLFDYIFNNGGDLDFEEYLEKHAFLYYEDCLKHKPAQKKGKKYKLTVVKAGGQAVDEVAKNVQGVRDKTVICDSCGDVIVGEPLVLWAPSRDFKGGQRLIQTSPVVQAQTWVEDGVATIEVLTKSGSVYRVEEL